MSFPDQSAQDVAETLGLSRVLDVLDRRIVIRHPHFSMRLALGPELGPKICYLLAVGDYEQSELELVKRYVTAEDSLLDVGGCAGVTAALAATITRAPVTVVEPNRQLHDLISEQATLNGGKFNIVGACVAGGSTASTTNFYLHSEPWRSKLEPAPNEIHDYRPISCSVISLNKLIEKWQPSVLMLDVEGEEENIVKERLAVRPRIFIVEIHNWLIGDQAACDVIQAIMDQGYRLVDRAGWNWVFENCD